MPWKIFINYRRADASGEAKLLYDRLVESFGADQVFYDLVNLQAGQKWLEEIKSHAGRSGVFLVVIGNQWLKILNQRSLAVEADSDVVKVEIETALSKGSSMEVIPVVFGDVREPTADELPRSLRPIAARHMVRFRYESLSHDIDLLIMRIIEIAEEKPAVDEEIVLQPPPPLSEHRHVADRPDDEHYGRIAELIVDEGSVVPLLGYAHQHDGSKRIVGARIRVAPRRS